MNLSLSRRISTLDGTLGVEDRLANAVAVLPGVGVFDGDEVVPSVGVGDGMSVGVCVGVGIIVGVRGMAGVAVAVPIGGGACVETTGSVLEAREHPCNKSKPANRKARRNAESE
jgi:hypothetical protein